MLCPGKKFFFLFDVDRFNDLKGSKGVVLLNLFICLNFFFSLKTQTSSGALPTNPDKA
ncbi:hypothetical protein D3C71_701390 [compost metagenome]